MGIEQRLDTVAASLEANSVALKELHAAINTLITAFTNLPMAKPEAVKVEHPKPAPTPAAPEVAPAEAAAPNHAVESPSDAPLDYAVVSKAITEAIKKDRQKVVDALTKFGVKKGPELKADQYADFLKALA